MKKLIIVIIMILLASCSPYKKRIYIKEGAKIGFIKKIAVLPFENHSKETNAGKRLRDIVITELLVQGIFDVVDKGLVDAILREEAIEVTTSLDQVTARRIARSLNIQAFMLGSVDDYRIERRGSYSFPVVVITLRLMDPKTGTIFWQASGMESGYTTLGRLFGIRAPDITEVSFRLVKRLISSLK